jgi:hypothetical protein
VAAWLEVSTPASVRPSGPATFDRGLPRMIFATWSRARLADALHGEWPCPISLMDGRGLPREAPPERGSSKTMAKAPSRKN